MPPRAVSSTAASTAGLSSTISADRGPDASAAYTSEPPTYTPSVHDMPTRSPVWPSTWLMNRTVLVLPFVPVTETTGTLVGAPGGYRLSTIAAATSRAVPSVGDRCMRRPGHAFS